MSGGAELSKLAVAAREESAMQQAESRTKKVTHLDDDIIQDLVGKKLSPEEDRNARRHVLFCKTCGSKVIQWTRKSKLAAQAVAKPAGAAGAAPSPAAAPRLSEEERQAVESRAWTVAQQRRVLRLVASATAFAIVVAFTAIVWTPDIKPESAALTPPAPAFVELSTLGPNTHVVEETVTLGEELVLTITAPGVESAHVYVLFLGPRGRLIGLAPRRDRLGKPEEFLASSAVVPDSARSPKPRGFRLGHSTALADGDRGALFVLTSKRSLAALEGRIRDEVVLPRLAEGLMEGDRDSLDEATARLMAARLEARFAPTLFKVFPLTFKK